jgi:hypothetical protein
MEDPTVVDRLRSLKPHHLIVTIEGEDEPRRLAVPNIRNRWQRVDNVLAQLRWTTIDARDKSGATLGLLKVADDDAPAAAAAPLAASGHGITIRERELCDLMLTAVDRGARAAQESADRALGRAERSLTLVAEGITAQLEMMSAATRAVVGQYSEALTLQRTLTAGPAPAADGDALAPLLALMARGLPVKAAAPPKNGAPKKPTES